MNRTNRFQILRGLQVALFSLLVVAMLGTTGCQWFRKGGEEVAEPIPPTTEMTPTQQPEALPTDAPTAGPRPGDLTPLPQMRVIYFDYDRDNIRPDQISNAQQNVEFLRANPAINVYITGHTDERGSTEYNFNLGMRRAASLRDYFVGNGIPAERIAISSKGEEEPAVLGSNEEAWARNRRAEFFQMH